MSHIRKALVIAHFHQHGRLRSDTVAAIRRLAAVFDRVILVSTNLNDAELPKVKSFCQIKVRENIGYDFFSYRTGILQLFEEDIDYQITLMNTSFIILELEKLIANYFKLVEDPMPNELFGLTMSQEMFPHIQSFLMTLSLSAWSAQPFIEWWQRMEPLNDRQEVINRYEIGLSLFMTAQGASFSTAFNHPPAHLLLIQPMGRPKRSLIYLASSKLRHSGKPGYQIDLSFLLHDTGTTRQLCCKMAC